MKNKGLKTNDININIQQKGENKKLPIYVQAIKWVTETISNTELKKIFKVYFVMFFFLATALAMFYAYKIISNENIIKLTSEKLTNNQENGENIRDFVVTPKIQHDLKKLVYILNAERAFIFELHNGKKNTSGLPFRFADMTYEVVNEDKPVDKVAMNFQDIPLTLYIYPHYLQKQKIMIGTVEEIEKIDKDYAGHIKEIGGKYLGMIYLNNGGTPIGFLCVSYHDLNNVPSKEVIKNKLTEYGNMLIQLLDLRMYDEKNNEVEE